MAVITLDITFESGETRSFQLAPEKLPLTLIEGMEDKKFGLMRRALARLLKLTEAESEELTIEHLNAISTAMQEATASPNGS